MSLFSGWGVEMNTVWRIAFLLGTVCLAFFPSACQLQVPIDEALYNACVDPYNREFRTKPYARSMVAGSGYGSTSCYWTWGNANQQQADARTIANCRKEKGSCEVFADSNGLVAWSRRISDNGGYSPGPVADPFARTLTGGSPTYSPSPRMPTPTYSGPVTPTPGSGGGDPYGCFNAKQNAIAAQFTPRVQQAVGICQSSNVSRDMWQAVMDAAIACKMPQATITQARANVEQSRQAAANSCM